MKVDPDRCPIVIVGAWNLAIFNKEWVSRVVFEGPIEAPAADFGLGMPVLRLRFEGPAFKLLVQPDRTVWVPKRDREEDFDAAERAACRLLDSLSVTPISAVGVNFGFDAAVGEGEIRRAIELGDSELLSRIGAVTRSTTVMRRLEAAGKVLNLTLSREGDEDIKIEVNYHRDVSSAQEALAKLKGSVLSLRRECVRFLIDTFRISTV